MKVLFAVRNNGADAWYRAVAPASVLRYNGWDVTTQGLHLSNSDEFDVLVLQRQCDSAAELIMRDFQGQGKPVIYDVDDWLFGMPPSWGCYKDYFQRGTGKPRSTITFHERILRRADLVTCPTEALAEKLRAYNERVRVLPNCVLWCDWDIVIPPEKMLDGPVIGWMGLPYHWDNWRTIALSVEQAVMDVGGYLAILGFPEVVHLFSDRLVERTVVQPLVPFAQFADMRTLIASFDVAIAWLDDTPFNRCKSPLRALQYGAAGVPMVASRVVYESVLDGPDYPGHFGDIVDTPEQQYHAIVDGVRKRMPAMIKARSWQQQVFAHHTYETQWHRWAKVIQEVTDETSRD